eukprot:COSAG03_NODE_19864_length_328_cov_1.362445_1_plen_92_part_10
MQDAASAAATSTSPAHLAGGAAAAGAPEPGEQGQLPAGWESAVSRSTGETYYRNTGTGETTYDWPHLPAGWESAVSRSTGETYYHNTGTGET